MDIMSPIENFYVFKQKKSWVVNGDVGIVVVGN